MLSCLLECAHVWVDGKLRFVMTECNPIYEQFLENIAFFSVCYVCSALRWEESVIRSTLYPKNDSLWTRGRISGWFPGGREGRYECDVT